MLRLRTSSFAGATCVALLFSGCSPVYVYKSWRGQHQLMSKRRPIAELLMDPATPDTLKKKLRLSEEIRGFAGRMGLPASKSYTSYADIGRPFVTYAVSAAPRLELRSYEWWFPLVGRVPYRGYFEIRDAEKERLKLLRKNFDVSVRGVPAYSTLGWYSDPVLSSMLQEPPGSLAETLIHELTHQAVYFKNDADFNEAVATFVGEQGAEDFLAAKFGAQSLEVQAYRLDRQDEAQHDRRWEEVAMRLEALYSSRLTDAEKLLKRQEIFDASAPVVGVNALNNAVILAHRLYRTDLGDFKSAYERLGREWPKMIALLKSLDKRRPGKSLKDWLAKGST